MFMSFFKGNHAEAWGLDHPQLPSPNVDADQNVNRARIHLVHKVNILNKVNPFILALILYSPEIFQSLFDSNLACEGGKISDGFPLKAGRIPVIPNVPKDAGGQQARKVGHSYIAKRPVNLDHPPLILKVKPLTGANK